MIKLSSRTSLVLLAALGATAFGQDIDQYSLFGTEGVSLMDRGACLSVCMVGSKGQVRIGADAAADGDVNALGTVFVADRGRIQGTLSTSDTVYRQYGSTIGVQRTRVAVSLPSVPNRTVTPGTQDLNVYSGQTLDLAPGNWGTVHLYAGTKLLLKAGTYHFQQLLLEPDVAVTADLTAGAIDVRTNVLSLGDRSKVSVVGGKEYQLSWYSSQAGSLYVGTDGIFRGILTAPSASVDLASRTYIYGGVRARYVGLQPDSRILRVTKPVELYPVFTTTMRWSEVPTGFGGELYCPEASDPKGLPVTISLSKTIPGVTLRSTGCLWFQTTRSQEDQYFNIQLTATNSAGYSTVQDFKIHTFFMEHFFLDISPAIDTIKAGSQYVFTPFFLFCYDKTTKVNTCSTDSLDWDGDVYSIGDWQNPTIPEAVPPTGMKRVGRNYVWQTSAANAGKTYGFVSVYTTTVVPRPEYTRTTYNWHQVVVQ